MERYYYTTKNLSEDLNGRVVCLNTRHDNHPNLDGPIEGKRGPLMTAFIADENVVRFTNG